MTYIFTNSYNHNITLNSFNGVQISPTKKAAYVKRGGVYYHYDTDNNIDNIELACINMLSCGANLLPVRVGKNNNTTVRTLKNASREAVEIACDILQDIKNQIDKIASSCTEGKAEDILNTLGYASIFDFNLLLTKCTDDAEKARQAREAELARREAELKAEQNRKQASKNITQAIKTHASSLTTEQLQAIQAILNASTTQA